eukprot:228378-Prymnesium_polylepis.1
MFLGAHGSTTHRLWVGPDASSLVAAAALGNDSNIFTPPAHLMSFGTQVAWRVDALKPDGGWAVGNIWHFTVEQGSPPPNPPAPPPPPCAVVATTDAPVMLMEPGGGLQKLDVDVLTGYPSSWIISSLSLCFSAWHTGGVGNALNFR